MVRKKPKDRGGVPTGGAGSSRGGGGGGGMDPVPAPPPPLPNYMRATSCSGAKSGAAAASGAPTAPQQQPQPQQGRAKVAVVVQTTAAAPASSAAAGVGVPRAGRATCSSAMKGGGSGPWASGVGGAAHACPYAYCSFKGHIHAHAPPLGLGSFVAERRRLIKTQQSMKHKGASPFRRHNPATTAGYFVEVRAGAAAPTVAASEVSWSDDLSAEDADADAAAEGWGGAAAAAAAAAAASVDGGSCGSSDVVSVGSVVEQLSWITKRRGGGGEGEEESKSLVEMGVVDHDEGEDFGACCDSDISEELLVLDANHSGNLPKGGDDAAPKESSVDSVSSSLSGISFDEDVTSARADAAPSSSHQKKNMSASIAVARRRRASEKGVEQQQTRPFKPKPPNFLPAETGPEAEKVDLKPQAVDDRRAAEEWMVDYALRKEVKKLARAQKRKVEMLVQAFESVLPTVANETKKPEQRDDGDKRTFTLTWSSSQACT